MLQPRFWHLVLFGLLTSCVVYNLNFARGTSRLPSGINSNSRLEPQPGKQHVRGRGRGRGYPHTGAAAS